VRLKNAPAIVLIIVVLVGTIATKPIESTSPPNTKVFVDPASIIDLTTVAGTQLTIRLNISDVMGLFGWELKLRFNPVLLYTNRTMIAEGPFLKQGGSTFFTASVVEDYVSLGSLLVEQSQVDGNGTLSTITFRVKTLGESTFELYATKLLDINLNLIAHEIGNGYFRNIELTHIPVANFVYSAQGYNVTFNASTSFDPDGTLSEYVWFWGGGSLDPIRESTTTNPMIYHLYPAKTPPEEENATVRLIVVDNDGITGNISVKLIKFGVSVHDIAVVSVGIFPHNILVGQNANINVTVTNKGNQIESFNVTICQNVTEIDYNNITNTQWETIQTKNVPGLVGFEERTLSFIVNTTGFSLGKHVVKAEADTVQNETDTSNNYLLASFTVAEILYPPVAKFSYSPEIPIVNETIVFNATQSFDPDGEVISFSWNFGDSNLTTVYVPIVVHVYAAHGTYNVTLTVFDRDELSNATWQLVKVYAKPVADFTYLPISPVVNEPIVFNASASNDPDGNIVSHVWDFGDGNVTSTPDSTITHTYTTYGNHSTTLTVVDNHGLASTKTKTVSVGERPKTNILPYVAVAIIIVAVALLLFYFSRRKRQSKQ